MIATLIPPPVIPVTGGGGGSSKKKKFDTTPYEKEGLIALKTQDDNCSFVLKGGKKFLVMLKPDNKSAESNNTASVALVPVNETCENTQDRPIWGFFILPVIALCFFIFLYFIDSIDDDE